MMEWLDGDLIIWNHAFTISAKTSMTDAEWIIFYAASLRSIGGSGYCRRCKLESGKNVEVVCISDRINRVLCDKCAVYLCARINKHIITSTSERILKYHLNRRLVIDIKGGVIIYEAECNTIIAIITSLRCIGIVDDVIRNIVVFITN